MIRKAWVRIVFAIAGLLALAVLIWFAGPLIAFADVRPFDHVWPRVSLIALTFAIAASTVLLRWWRRKEASAALERSLVNQDESEGDAVVLQQAMKDALATLRQVKKKGGDYLYDMPWYIIIGPPGVGKTTALVNSGLKFPLARSGTPKAVTGIGGTRYCDWWFSEEAVLIDTAGRYTTQDTDSKTDHKSWLSFLELLRKNRPKQPINGVLVAISLEDLITANTGEIAAHADAIRKRLNELHEHLKIDFPVYVLLTKADLVAGFMEYFGSLTETDRRRVWGHTFQTGDRSKNMLGDAAAEYDALLEQLSVQLLDRLQNEAAPSARVAIFGFTSQMAMLKNSVIGFLNHVFEPTRYQTSIALRGFYFTSGTQKGTPIDQLISKLEKNFGLQEMAHAIYSGKGKSFFLTDLLQKVVLGEAGWVSVNRAEIHRAITLKAAALGAISAVAVLIGALWYISFNRNRELIHATSNAIAEYRTIAAPVLRETAVSDRNFVKVLPLLHKLRYLPVGYAFRSEAEPVTARYGLSQRDRLQSASETAYQAALERIFRARLIFRLEEQLEGNVNNPAFIYEALKVYLMVGGQAPVDRDLVSAWMRGDWAENLFPGAANMRGRQALEEHLVAMFDLADGREQSFPLNTALIEDCQRTLARMSVADRAYELLKSQARSNSYRDWIVAKRGGADVGLVFEGVGGTDLDSVRVPVFYTYDGFHSSFMDQLTSIGQKIEQERWVLGDAGQQTPLLNQYDHLYQDLLQLYTRDFIAAWQQALRRLKLRPLTADKPRYVALSAAGAATSPIKQLIESIRAETQLTRERPPSKQRASVESKGLLGTLVGSATTAIDKSAGIITGKPVLPEGSVQNGLLGSGAGQAPGATIETQFKSFHVLVEGEGGRQPIDALLQNLREINETLAITAPDPSQVSEARDTLVKQVAALRANGSRFPSPFDQMIRTLASEFEGDAATATIADLQQALADQVTRVCQQILTNRYPFVKGIEREVPLADFARLFAPNGIMDKFFGEKLAPYADQSQARWVWRADNSVARNLSPVTLRQFQQASEIREAFFPNGGNLPSFTMSVTPLTMSGEAAGARLEINGTAVVGKQGVNAPTSVNWPGGGISRSAITIGGSGIFRGFFQQPAVVEKQGTWSFFKLLELGTVSRQGDSVIASFVVDGREVTYQFNVGSLMNPLLLEGLRDFRCPQGI
ncbi:type VI secretion system membrane subunit TssM [Microvirga sp. 0TCS3.31]